MILAKKLVWFFYIVSPLNKIWRNYWTWKSVEDIFWQIFAGDIFQKEERIYLNFIWSPKNRLFVSKLCSYDFLMVSTSENNEKIVNDWFEISLRKLKWIQCTCFSGPLANRSSLIHFHLIQIDPLSCKNYC